MNQQEIDEKVKEIEAMWDNPKEKIVSNEEADVLEQKYGIKKEYHYGNSSYTEIDLVLLNNGYTLAYTDGLGIYLHKNGEGFAFAKLRVQRGYQLARLMGS